MDLTIVIPAFNEESCIPELIFQLNKTITVDLKELRVEVIIVDDHSSDQTPLLINNHKSNHPWLKSIRLLKNSGSHIAIFAGITQSQGRFIYCMGADLQDPPSIIKNFVVKIKEGHKVVFGKRVKRQDPLLKSVQAKIFHFLMSKLVMKNYPQNGGDVFMIDRDIANAIITSKEKNVNIFVLMLSFSDDVSSVEYDRSERHSGQSKWNFIKLLKLAFDSVVTVGAFPLKMMFWFGIAFSFLALVIIIYLIYGRITGNVSVVGWASTIASILVVGGSQMVCVSILGEYLWRNYEQTKMRPIFILENQERER